ncbi:hypothetical protein ACWV95_22715 [Streptomyces albus]
MLGRRSDWTTAEAEIRKRSSRAALKVERDHARELEKLVGALAESRETLHLTPATVERVVRTALHLAHRKDLTAVPDPAVSPRGDGSGAARCFRLPELPGAWAHARNEGLHHPLTGRERPVVFDEAEARGRTDVVLLHLGADSSRCVCVCCVPSCGRAARRRACPGSPRRRFRTQSCVLRRLSRTAAW